MSTEKLFEPGDVTRYSGGDVQPASVRRDADLGRIRVAATTPRGTRLFRAEDVENYLQERRAKIAARGR